MKVYAVMNDFWSRHIVALYTDEIKAHKRADNERKAQPNLPDDYIFVRTLEVIE